MLKLFCEVLSVFVELLFFVLFTCGVLILTGCDFIWIKSNNTLQNAAKLSIAWILLGIAFSGVIHLMYGSQGFFEYLSAYFIEKSLSVDNIFVFFLIFSSFNIIKKYQHEVLFIGIWTAIILRLIMILVVGKILEEFHFVMYLFGGFILYAGIASFKEKSKEDDYKKLTNVLKKFIRIHDGDHEGHFLIRKENKIYATTLLVALLVIEISDVVFAFDSIPALFSITNNKTIIYTSNILAIIGLRSLYGLFAEMIDRFLYMKRGVSLILLFVGAKMITADVFTINAEVSLCIIATILFGSIVMSIVREK